MGSASEFGLSMCRIFPLFLAILQIISQANGYIDNVLMRTQNKLTQQFVQAHVNQPYCTKWTDITWGESSCLIRWIRTIAAAITFQCIQRNNKRSNIVGPTFAIRESSEMLHRLATSPMLVQHLLLDVVERSNIGCKEILNV